MADARRADRPEKRNARDRQSRRSANQRDDVGIVFEIMAQYGTDHLRFVYEPGGKERPQRPVDQSRDQCFLFRWAAFALEEAARDLAGGKCLFLIIDRQRKKILIGLRGFHGDDGAQNRRLAIARQHRAVGLAGQPAGLENQPAATPRQFFTEYFEHTGSSFLWETTAEAAAPDQRRSPRRPISVSYRAMLDRLR